MDRLFFLLPYFFSAAISLGVLAYTWRFRSVKGASAYLWYMAGQSLWIIGYIFELLSQDIDGKLFWDQTQWVAGIFITLSFPVFAVQYTGVKIRQPRLLFCFSFIVPFLLLVTLFADSQFHLLYPNPHLDHSVLFSNLKYDFTWLVYSYAVYGYFVTLTGLGILIKRAIHPHLLYRRQIFTVAIGFFIPIFLQC